jgi:hypothetical protein
MKPTPTHAPLSFRRFWFNIENSFKNNEYGYSGRKLSAFVAILIAGKISLTFATSENIVMLSTVWLAFALLCFGIIQAADIIKFKNGTTVQEEHTEVIQTTSKTVSNEQPAT